PEGQDHLGDRARRGARGLARRDGLRRRPRPDGLGAEGRPRRRQGALPPLLRPVPRALRRAVGRLRKPAWARRAGRAELQRAARPVRGQHHRRDAADGRPRGGEEADHREAAPRGRPVHCARDEEASRPGVLDGRLTRAGATRPLAAALLAAGLAAAAAAAGPSGPALKVVAKDLNNPRKLFVAGDGAVYVVEAGVGGRDRCLGTGPRRVCVGLSGAISRIAGGATTRVVTGLWSGARPDRHEAQGPADVLVRGGRYFVLLQDASIDRRGFNALGPDGATAGDLISTPPGRAAPAVIFNFAAFEAARNPDRGAGPGAKLGNPPIDSDPYAFTAYRGGFAVVDAAGNDLLWVKSDGEVSVLAVFPVQRVPLTPAVRRRIGVPASLRSIAVQSVPTCVAVGPDGALYVGELTGVPFARGTARVWR